MAAQTDRPAHVVFASGLYPLGAGMTLFPVVDIASRLLPPHLGDLQWRLTAVGTAVSALWLMILGLGIIGLTAALHHHRLALRILAIIAWVGAVLLAAVLVLFTLDAVQALGLVQNAQLRPQLVKATVATVMAAILAAVALGGLALAATRAARALGNMRDRDARSKNKGLVFTASSPGPVR